MSDGPPTEIDPIPAQPAAPTALPWTVLLATTVAILLLCIALALVAAFS